LKRCSREKIRGRRRRRRRRGIGKAVGSDFDSIFEVIARE